MILDGVFSYIPPGHITPERVMVTFPNHYLMSAHEAEDIIIYNENHKTLIRVLEEKDDNWNRYKPYIYAKS